MDLGVSSLQLDERERGFAYSYDAPLDMRMAPMVWPAWVSAVPRPEMKKFFATFTFPPKKYCPPGGK